MCHETLVLGPALHQGPCWLLSHIACTSSLEGRMILISILLAEIPARISDFFSVTLGGPAGAVHLDD